LKKLQCIIADIFLERSSAAYSLFLVAYFALGYNKEDVSGEKGRFTLSGI